MFVKLLDFPFLVSFLVGGGRGGRFLFYLKKDVGTDSPSIKGHFPHMFFVGGRTVTQQVFFAEQQFATNMLFCNSVTF